MKKFHLLLAGILFTVPLFAAELVKEGNALAEIIIPENALKIEKYAAEELSSHLEKISGAKLAVRTSPSDKAVQIRLGRAAKMPRIAFRRNSAWLLVQANVIVNSTALNPENQVLSIPGNISASHLVIMPFPSYRN